MKLLMKIVTLFFLVFCASCSTMEGQIDQAISLAGKGNFKAALNIYQQALEKDPANPLILNNYGWTLFHADSLTAARSILQDAISHDQQARYLKRIETNLFMVDSFLAGKKYLARGDAQEALVNFQKVTDKMQVHAIGFQYLGLCYEALDDCDAAQENWEKIVSLYAGSPAKNNFYQTARSKLKKMAGIATKNGNYEKAIYLLGRLVEAEKDSAARLNDLGQAHFLNDDLIEAKEILEQAGNLYCKKDTQDSIETHLFIVTTFLAGEYSLRKEQYKSALAEFQKVTERYPETDIGLKYLALCYEGLNEKKKSDELFQRIAYRNEGNKLKNKYFKFAISKLKLEIE